MGKDPFRRAMVLYANHADFPPGRTSGSDRVESRMLLWCRRGNGIVRVNGQSFDFEPGRFLILPWGHSVRYRADKQHGLILAGIHVVPSIVVYGEPVFYVRHSPARMEEDDTLRSDVALSGFDGVREGHFTQWPALEHLAEYIVQWFSRGPSQAIARLLARQLIQEWQAWNEAESAPELPAALRRALQFIGSDLGEPLEIEDLARSAERSAPTLFRLFRQHLGTTPKLWLQKQRMARAGELLQTTLLPINEVGRRVGISDAQYFSRLFRQSHGMTATEYRRKTALL